MQEATSSRTRETPAEIVAGLDAQAKRLETPCGDGAMVWRLWGSGPAMLLLHGGHGAWSHWIRNIPTLARRFTVIAPDMPGYADSASPPQPYTAESMGEIMAAGLARILGRDRLTIVGFSFGGVMGGQVAKRLPAQVERLVLVGSGGLGLPRPKMGEMKNWRRLTSEAERLAAHRNNLGVLMLHDPKNIDALALHLQATNTVRTRINSRAISLTDALRQSLARFDAPLAGIWGAHDATAAGPDYLDAREKLLRSFDAKAEFIRLDAGHWVQYEAPEAFHTALMSIIEAGRMTRGK